MAGNKSVRMADTGAGKRKSAPAGRTANRPTGRNQLAGKYVSGKGKSVSRTGYYGNTDIVIPTGRGEFYSTPNPNAARDQRRWDATVQRAKKQTATNRSGKKTK